VQKRQRTKAGAVSQVDPIPFRTVCGRRVEVDIQSRDLARPVRCAPGLDAMLKAVN
jgi:hypothetical protein